MLTRPIQRKECLGACAILLYAIVLLVTILHLATAVVQPDLELRTDLSGTFPEGEAWAQQYAKVFPDIRKVETLKPAHREFIVIPNGQFVFAMWEGCVLFTFCLWLQIALCSSKAWLNVFLGIIPVFLGLTLNCYLFYYHYDDGGYEKFYSTILKNLFLTFSAHKVVTLGALLIIGWVVHQICGRMYKRIEVL